jgi:hypothetical protein
MTKYELDMQHAWEERTQNVSRKNLKEADLFEYVG